MDVQGTALQCPDLPVIPGKESCLHTMLCTPLALYKNLSDAAGIFVLPSPCTCSHYMQRLGFWLMAGVVTHEYVN